MEDIPEYYTVNEIALMFKRHPQTIRAAAKDGSLHTDQTGKGKHHRILVECAKAWSAGDRCAHYKPRGLHLKRAS